MVLPVTQSLKAIQTQCVDMDRDPSLSRGHEHAHGASISYFIIISLNLHDDERYTGYITRINAEKC